VFVVVVIILSIVGGYRLSRLAQAGPFFSLDVATVLALLSRRN
jgi:hypothetical protein